MITYNSDNTVHITWDDGSYYDGEYRNNAANGKGFLFYASKPQKSYQGGFYDFE